VTRHKLFRNPQGAKVYPIRDFLGANMPSGREGFVIEDLDWNVVAPEDAQLLIVRRFGESYGLDATGEFLIGEFKHRPDLGTWLDEAQKRTFGLLDEQCRLGDVARAANDEPLPRYCGFYVVAYNEPQPSPLTRWRIRRIGGARTKEMNWGEFSNWLQVVHIGGDAA
jgi:hypothetical protein